MNSPTSETPSVEGSLPIPDTLIFQNEKQVGWITSVAPLPVGSRHLVLAYLSRNADFDDALHAGDAKLRSVAPLNGE